MSDTLFSKIKREVSLSGKVESQIIKAIQQKMFLPGDKLPGEMDLAQNFGVSRTAIREAINRLIGRGVVEYRKGSGVFVAEAEYSSVIDPLYHLLEMKCGNASLLQIAGVRLVIEPDLTKIAAGTRDDSDIKYWEDCCDKMESNIENPAKMIEYDIQFHRRIGISTRNQLIPVMMEPIYLLMGKFITDTYTRPKSPSLAIKWHRDILKSIIEQDGDGAYEAMRNHMLEAQEHASVFRKND